MRVPLAWHNVFQNKRRTIAAVCGISFSILLVFMQLGFLNGGKTAAASLFEIFNYDIGIVSEKYTYLATPGGFDRIRLTQALAHQSVHSAASMSFSNGAWKDKDSGLSSRLIILGVPLDQRFIKNDLIKTGVKNIRPNHTVLVDLYSHKDYGDLSIGNEVEINQASATIAGHFQLGVGLFSEGCVIVSNDNFARLTGNNPRLVNYGFLRLKQGVDTATVVAQLRKMLPKDVFIYSKTEMIRKEQAYFIAVKPVGIIFQSGVIVACFAGIVILLQVLNTDISNRLDEFATLKAIGFSDGYIYSIGVQQALIYALLSFVPALIIATFLFRVTHELSRLPMEMTLSLVLFVLAVSLVMCIIACLLGLQKVRRTDPAELS